MNEVISMRKRIGNYPICSVNPTPRDLNNEKSINVKIYDFNALSKVSGNGIRLLDYIFNYCLDTSNYIEIDQLEAEKYLFGERTRASNAYVYRGIISLLEAGIISRAVTKNYYWFNLNIICTIK